jgi:hypothetical protein
MKSGLWCSRLHEGPAFNEAVHADHHPRLYPLDDVQVDANQTLNMRDDHPALECFRCFNCRSECIAVSWRQTAARLTRSQVRELLTAVRRVSAMHK